MFKIFTVQRQGKRLGFFEGRRPLTFILALGLFCSCFAMGEEHKRRWLEVELSVIGPASRDILHQAFNEASSKKVDGVLLILDTPGGALDATREMVKEMMSQPIPVVVWVGPSGARAGSAGAFITLASHMAVMAEGTNIGAAHPVQANGESVDDEEMKKKIENDTAAFMESIAQARERNVDMAVSFVVNSLSITASEALENNVIDLIANDRRSLWQQLDGKSVRLTGDKVIELKTASVQVIRFEKSIKQQLLEILSNPNLFYLLFIAGILGIGFELTHPGSLIPGVVGSIAMLLALIAMSVLPVSFGALLLVLASIAFMIAEAFVPSFGILGIGGAIGFVVGSVLLVDPNNDQGLQISLWTIIPTSMVFLSLLIAILVLVVKSEKGRFIAGAEAMIGDTVTAIASFDQNGRGRVKYQGEFWQASIRSESIVRPGDELEIVSRKGLVLTVQPKKMHRGAES